MMTELNKWIRDLHKSGAGWMVKIAAGLLGVAGVALLVIVAGMIWRGDVWAFIIYAENPYTHLAGAFGCLVVGYYIWRGYRHDVRTWGRFIGKCFLAGFGLGIAAVIGEIGIRAQLIKQQKSGSIHQLRDERAMDRVLQSDSIHPMAAIIDVSTNLQQVFELRPGLDMKFGHRKVRTNRHGMRSDVDYTEEKPADTLRIVGLGDSGMFGWDVEQGEEYMAVLERVLNERDHGIRYEVLNLGVPGYNTQLEVESLVYKGLKFDPDIVVLGWCANDYQLPFFMLQTEDFTRRDISFLHTYMFRRKDMADLIAGRRVSSMRGFDEGRVERGLRSGAGQDGVRQALLRLKRLSEEHGFKALVSGPLTPDILALVDEVGLPSFNTLEEINAADYPEDYAVHYMHPRPGGHAVIGAKLAMALERAGWLP